MAIDDRKRNFGTIVYPESAPDDWISYLDEMCIPCFISPLHDSDVLPTGEIKKPHYHVLFMFEGKKSDRQIDEIINAIGGVGIEVVHSIRGNARYLTHMDSPDKAQYSSDDVICIAGADYYNVITLPSDKYAVISEMIDYCDANDIYSFADLLRYSRINKNDWFRILCDSGTLVIKEFLKSKTWENKN